MWRTSRGNRILEGKERSLFVHTAASLLDYLLAEARADEPDPDCAWHTGVALFDQTDPQARIILLRDVVQALTDPTVPTPRHTAINEAAIHAVFRFLRGEIEMEIDCADFCRSEDLELDNSSFILGNDPFYWRNLVLAAYREGRGPTDNSDGEENLDLACDDMEEWDLHLECLADQILWDRDWELEEILDMPPEQARRVKHLMGIDQDYFLVVPSGPDNAQLQDAVAYLHRLADEDRGDQEYATVTLRYDYDGLVGLEFADGDLNRQPGCPVAPDVESLDDAEVTLPLLLAVDAAKLLKKIQAAQHDEEKIWTVMKSRERLCHWLHHYLPEAVQKRFRQRFEIAPGISAERDYGTAAVEFNVEKFTGVKFDEQTRAELDVATEGLKAFLLHLVSDCHYDFSDEAVRQALIQTADQMAQEFAEDHEASEEQ